ncbi:MAG: helix-turn-helix domain-containing protein [Peptococcaceae bacterium]
MPWKEINKIDQRTEFVHRAPTETIPFSELCKEYNISRKTGYKWKQRFLDHGYNGMPEQRPMS